MPIDVSKSQGVYKDAGSNVIFATMNLKRQDYQTDLETIEDLSDRLPAFERSMNIRYPDAGLAVAFGISSNAWDYLFPHAKKPAELEEFAEMKGPKYSFPYTPADLFFHVRSKNSAVTYEIMEEIMERIGADVDVLDETNGFRYFEGRAIIGFVDGTENPDKMSTPEYALIGDEDPDFINGSYAFAQKYLHDMKKWNAMKVEMQEKAIGRKKFNDMELEDEEKDPNAHNVASQDMKDGVEHKIVRMNVPYSNPANEVTGTYFIGYAREWYITKRMLTNMIEKSDRILDVSTAQTGEVFFIPSLDTLEAIADGELEISKES